MRNISEIILKILNLGFYLIFLQASNPRHFVPDYFIGREKIECILDKQDNISPEVQLLFI